MAMKAKNQQIILAALITTSIAFTFTGCSDSDSQPKSKIQIPNLYRTRKPI
ncbi:hypothetical protein LDG_7239 [Legionella drancourtii LLAP12]|uniref:Uncharacterized protein n=1 Tax=Legionella drancourtii LLAP12 TaxID=658187 RepID=G9EPQ1_9GAMM|nr:hypothetical protein LDG_7239 [Legionella drancourtii LLAP12]